MTAREVQLLTAWRREVAATERRLKNECSKNIAAWEREAQLADRALSLLRLVYRHETRGGPLPYPRSVRAVLAASGYLRNRQS